MSRLRTLLAGLGVVAAVLGFAMLASQDLAASFRTSQAFLVVLGAVAGVQVYRVIRARRRSAVDTADTPDPETEQDLPVPGEDFDELVANLRGLRRPNRSRFQGQTRFVRARERVDERLEAAALETIVRKCGCTRRQARAALDAGTWTDDPVAAAFFTGSLEAVPLRRRIGLALSSQAQYQRRATRAASAIADLADRDDVRPGEVAA